MIKSKIFVFLFKGLIIQGRDTDETDTTLHKFVKFFKLAWKKDDQTPWADVDFVFTTNLSDGKSEKKIEFEVPIIAKYLKIILLQRLPRGFLC